METYYKDLNFEKGSANSAFKVVSVAVQGTFLRWVECMGFPEFSKFCFQSSFCCSTGDISEMGGVYGFS